MRLGKDYTKEEYIKEILVKTHCTDRAIMAFVKVQRELFVPKDQYKHAYADHPLDIGHDQTISQPWIVIDMCGRLDPKPGSKVLEVGAGSGYQAAILKEMVGKKGKVVAVERIPELVMLANKNLRNAHYEVEVVIGDGTLGYPKEAPYDAIIVSASAPGLPPPLIGQLKAGGRIIIPLGVPGMGPYCQMCLFKKGKGGKLKRKELYDCVFVPLRGRYGWKQ